MGKIRFYSGLTGGVLQELPILKAYLQLIRRAVNARSLPEARDGIFNGDRLRER